MTWGRFFFDEHYTHSFVTTPRRVSHLLECQGFNVVLTERVLGWYWVRGSVLKNITRHGANVGAWLLRTPPVYWLAEYCGLGRVHWKISKTFFEAVVMVAVNTANGGGTWDE